MRNIFLGLLALSTVSLGAAVNEASVPVRVVAEIIAPTESLVITDEAGTVLDEILLEHYIVGAVAGRKSKDTQVFKVKRTDANGLVDANANGSAEITLSNATTTLAKQGGAAKDTLSSTLNLIGGTGGTRITTNLVNGEYTGTVESSIIIGDDLTAGRYDNALSTDNRPTLSVTYSAN